MLTSLRTGRQRRGAIVPLAHGLVGVGESEVLRGVTRFAEPGDTIPNRFSVSSLVARHGAHPKEAWHTKPRVPSG
jgi:hypothetical protein